MQALHNSTVPPAVNGEHVDSQFGLKAVTKSPVDAKIDYALSYAYALGGGQNASLLIKRYCD